MTESTPTKDLQALLAFARDNARVGRIDTAFAYGLSDRDTGELVEAARRVSRTFAPRTFNFCSIVNAKSGRCTEDCAWCAQSRRFATDCVEYDLMDAETVLKHALAVEKSGVRRFSLVTSGRKLSPREVREVCSTVRLLREKTNLEICLSAGLLKEEELRSLFAAGVVRYHCNLESSPVYFGKLCTTHTVADKIATLRAAKSVGMEICSGGILGMGESEKDRIALALALKDLETPSIPINILHPIAGTPLGARTLLEDEAILRSVAIFRLIHPRAYLRFAGGRAQLSDEVQRKCLEIGINSAITGDMLTTHGTAADKDRRLVSSLGYRLEDDDTLTYDRDHIWHPYAGTLKTPRLEHVVGAHGVRLVLADGRELIDGTSSWWCAYYGYARPELVQAICAQAKTLSHVMFGGLTHDPAVELTRRLLTVVPKGLTKVFYSDSGSVSIEIAMKMAVQYQVASGHPNRRNFLTLRHGYHGDTRNAMSVCDPVDGMHTLFGPDIAGRIFIESPKSRFDGDFDPADLRELEEVLEARHDEICAFILEPVVQGASAMRFYHPEYLKHAKALCEKYGVLLIADEIATGFGRTGRAFACDWAGITPDIMTVGKGLTGGMLTLAATLTTNKVADTISGAAPFALMHGPTFMANPLACRTACAALDLFQTLDWEEATRRIQAYLREELTPLASHPAVVDVRVCGSIGVVEVVPEKAADLRRLQPAFVDAGVWVRPIGTLFYLMPPVVIEEGDQIELVAAFKRVLLDWLEGRL